MSQMSLYIELDCHSLDNHSHGYQYYTVVELLNGNTVRKLCYVGHTDHAKLSTFFFAIPSWIAIDRANYSVYWSMNVCMIIVC